VSSLVVAAGDGAVVVILASIVVPMVALAGLCWVFWKHRHDE